MPYGLYLSAAGANAQSHRLDVLSHNLANVNTPGFKPHLSMLKSREAEAIARGDVVSGSGGVDDIGGGVAIQPNVTQFSQGPVRPTGIRTDMAIKDPNSFFVVMRNGQEHLTRAGNFQFTAQGQLVTESGDLVMAAGGGPITIDPTQPYEVTADGAILQYGQRTSPLLAKPREMGDLARVGDNLFRPLGPIESVGAAQRSLVSGHLEQSAVQPTMAMMELIEASRAYEANIRLIQNHDTSMGSLIGRVLQSD